MLRIKRIPKLDVIFKKMKGEGIESQKELAKIAEIDEDTLGQLLSGDRSSHHKTYKKLAQALKVDDYHELCETIRIDESHAEPPIKRASNEEGDGRELVTKLTERLLAVLLTPTVDATSVNLYLVSVGQLIREHLHQELSWIDVMRHVPPDHVGDRLLDSTNAGRSGWLKLEFSEILRTGRPRLIPVDVGSQPWRGSGAAFWSNGVDYIDRLTTRLVPQEYDLPLQEAERVASLYREWEQGHHFASLTAVAIPSKTNEQEACGVLNLNFAVAGPFGTGSTLAPEALKRIQSVLKPHVTVLSEVLSRLP
jgi:transcriptional regulator with XRE-family HTH domain